jgi:glucokinase
LGEAGLIWNENSYYPFPTEGGHSFFGPQTETDIALYWYLKKIHKQVTWEHVASGPAIYSTYQFLRDEMNMEEPAWLKEKMNNHADNPAVISEEAIKGSTEICIKTMELFIRYLAKESCNLILKMKATSGLFLGGGIPPKIAALLRTGSFYRSFTECDEIMEDLMQTVSVKLILNNKTALIGAAYFGAFGMKQSFS